jgi:hypothetical protein
MRLLTKIIIRGFVLFLVSFWISEAHTALGVTLAWDPDTDPNLAGYRLYYGTADGVFTHEVEVGTSTTVSVSNLVDGQTYFFVVTAYNASAVESAPSNEVSYTVPGSAPASTSKQAGPPATTVTAAHATTPSSTPRPTRILRPLRQINPRLLHPQRRIPPPGFNEASAYARWSRGEP